MREIGQPAATSVLHSLVPVTAQAQEELLGRRRLLERGGCLRIALGGDLLLERKLEVVGFELSRSLAPVLQPAAHGGELRRRLLDEPEVRQREIRGAAALDQRQ